MISPRRSSVYSKVHESREAFCCISSALVATPPAFTALPGANRTPASRSARIASGVVGMFAPSATMRVPPRINAAAPSASSSFCVAQGNAIAQGTSQIDRPGTKRTPGRCSA